ncbi:phytoene desaturase family protein [Mycetocola tolaasinivorans]|uniref:phytoene desaturase family protein n=1 Tax=Mycetocola tolaasinivorans TaxID=76635 RepID=UPI001FE358E5|nr:phytoene desaturase family protein [Mycetocola tolaasinivorans]
MTHHATHTPAQPPHAIVIGGGVAGLATAGLLARDGYRVTLLEQNEAVGGRAGSWSQDGFRFDTGPSWYLMPEVFDHFFALMGSRTSDELSLETLDPGYRVIVEEGHEALDIRANLAANRALFESLEPGSGPAFDRYIASADETLRLASDSFLYTNFENLSAFSRRAVLRRAGKLVRLLSQSLHGFARAHFRDPRILQILGYPAVFLGSSPFRAPAIYHLMSGLDLSGGVQYPQGGFTELVGAMARLAERAGVGIETSSRVLEITTAPGARVPRGVQETGGKRGPRRGVRQRAHATGVRVERNGEIRELSADIVISAADLHHTETALLPPALQSRPERTWKRTVPGPGTVLVFLGVRGELPELPHHTLLFTTDWRGNFSRIDEATPPAGDAHWMPEETSLYVCHPSASDASVAPPGHSNLFVLVPVPSDPELGGEGDAEVEHITDAAIDQIAAWAKIPDLRERIVVRRSIGPRDFESTHNAWRGTALGLAHTTGQSAFFRGRNVSSRVSGLYYAGATTVPGIGLPMCLISAELVLKRVRGERSSSPLPEPTAVSASATAPASHTASPAERENS